MLRIERPAPAVAVLTLERPPVNAIDADGYRELAAALRRLGGEGGEEPVGAAVIAGAGERVFSGGTDTAAFADAASGEEVSAAALDFFERLAAAPFPLVAAVNGAAVGAGAMIAAQCDLVLAVPDAYFRVPELQEGWVGAARHVKRLAGYHKGMRMMLLGEPLPAAEAHAGGVVLELVARERLVERAVEVARSVAELDRAAVADSLRIMREPESALALEGYREELGALSRLIDRSGG